MSPCTDLVRALFPFFKKDCIHLFFREGKGGRKRERNITVWLPLPCTLLGTWPATQACVLTRNQTSDLLIHRPALNALSHSQAGEGFLRKVGRSRQSGRTVPVSENLSVGPSLPEPFCPHGLVSPSQGGPVGEAVNRTQASLPLCSRCRGYAGPCGRGHRSPCRP